MNYTKSYFITILILTILFQSCQNSTNKENQADSISTDSVIVAVDQKSREELIVNRDTIEIKDSLNPTDFELKHTPEITLGEKDEKGYAKIYIFLGSEGIKHPEEESHWIDFIDLYSDGKLYKHHEFANDSSAGKIQYFIPLEKAKKITVYSGCNLHGVWKKEIEL